MSWSGLLRRGPVAPILAGDVELSRPLPDLRAVASRSGTPYGGVRLLVRLHGRPLGYLRAQLPAGGLPAADLAALLWATHGDAVARHMNADGLPRPTTLTAGGLAPAAQPPCSWRASLPAPPPATIVITTCCEGAALLRTVRSALAQDYPAFEVLVVDNRPATSEVSRFLGEHLGGADNLRYVAEDLRGLSHARNRGAAAARSEIVAFTDDDVTLDAGWLGSLVAGFGAADDVVCVTGLIEPGELETSAQIWFEEFGGFGKGLAQKVWGLAGEFESDALYPYRVGAFGSGASAAFLRSFVLESGGFDVQLGAGTPARGGEDLDIYTSIVLAGHRLVYEPGALLWHTHRPDMSSLRAQVRDYGTGLSAMLTKHLADPRTRRAVLRRISPGLAHAFAPSSAKHSGKSHGYPLGLTFLEAAGVAYGPVAYFLSRHRNGGSPAKRRRG